MDVGIKEAILAVVTIRKDIVCGENIPVFYAKDEEEKEKLAL